MQLQIISKYFENFQQETTKKKNGKHLPKLCFKEIREESEMQNNETDQNQSKKSIFSHLN